MASAGPSSPGDGACEDLVPGSAATTIDLLTNDRVDAHVDAARVVRDRLALALQIAGHRLGAAALGDACRNDHTREGRYGHAARHGHGVVEREREGQIG